MRGGVKDQTITALEVVLRDIRLSCSLTLLGDGMFLAEMWEEAKKSGKPHSSWERGYGDSLADAIEDMLGKRDRSGR